MRIGCGTAIAPRKAHIAGCKGTAVCADTQCLLRHRVSVVANGTREYLWDGPRFPAAMACSMEAAEAACAAADANEAAADDDASAASATASRAGAEAPRATTGRTLVRVRALLCHAERHPVRARPAGARRQAAAPCQSVGAVRVLRWLPRPILSVRRKHAHDDLACCCEPRSAGGVLGSRPAGLGPPERSRCRRAPAAANATGRAGCRRP